MIEKNKIKLPSAEKTIIYLVVIYIVGIAGMLIEATRDIFIFLVPINIIGSAIILLLYHRNWSAKFVVAATLIYVIGYLIEWLGVCTNVIFGAYQYGNGLGPKVLQVPPIMGINWFLLVYGSAAIISNLTQNKFIIASIGASLMVIYDLFLEPSAVQYNFWNWTNGAIPIQNYLAWWVSAFVFIIFYVVTAGPRPKNQVAEALFWLQLIFFGCLYLGNKFIF